MIYMVDHVYADPATEPAWNDWYAANIGHLLTVPGVHSAQRFKAIGQRPSRYLSMYSVDSGDVFRSAAYKKVGGGGGQSARFHHAYGDWTRNLFEGAQHAPEILEGQRIFVVDSAAPGEKLPGNKRPLWLKAAPGLPTSTSFSAQRLATTPHRAVIVLDRGDAHGELAGTGGYLYEPITPVLRPKLKDGG